MDGTGETDGAAEVGGPRPAAPSGGSGGGALFSPRWFAGASALAGAVRFPAVDLSVEYRCTHAAGDVTHHQAFRAGRLVAWGRGGLAGADLCLRQPLGANLAMVTRTGLGDGLLRDTAVVDPATGAEAPPPPLDEVVVDWGGDLPAVPTAEEFVVQQVLTHSPFGTVSTWHRLRRGRVVDSSLGTASSPDVTAQRRYGDALGERAGRVDVLESIQRGRLTGDFKKMALFLGIYDSDECRDARVALTTPALGPLAALGELLSSPGWRAVAGRLTGATSEMRSIP